MFLCLLFLCHSTPRNAHFVACKAQSFLKTSTYSLAFKPFRESRNNSPVWTPDLKAILFPIKNILILPRERREVSLKQTAEASQTAWVGW